MAVAAPHALPGGPNAPNHPQPEFSGCGAVLNTSIDVSKH